MLKVSFPILCECYGQFSAQMAASMLVLTQFSHCDFYLQFIKLCFACIVTVQLLALYEKHSHQGHAQAISVLKTRTSTVAPLSTSITKQAKLYSRTRMFMQINQNGQVSGTANCNSLYGKSFRMIS
jgi:hypothetical protein